jgi:hypothetical protein
MGNVRQRHETMWLLERGLTCLPRKLGIVRRVLVWTCGSLLCSRLVFRIVPCAGEASRHKLNRRCLYINTKHSIALR